LVRLTKEAFMSIVNIYEAKAQLSALVERAAAGEEIVIAKNGAPKARLVPLPQVDKPRTPAKALGLSYIADDFDAPDETVLAMFEGDT
jgi:prevent-host-death family protein